MEAATITRQALYELVWTVPRSRLAARFGVSDVAIAKRCRKIPIPMPGAGYWARIAAGQKPRRKKLPQAPDGVETESVFGTLTKSELTEAVPVPEVTVSERLSEPHDAVLLSPPLQRNLNPAMNFWSGRSPKPRRRQSKGSQSG